MSETIEQKTFCQICRHPTPGHERSCPVYTGQPVRGMNVWPSQAEMQAAFPQEMQGQLSQLGNVAVICPHCGGLNGVHVWAGQGMCPGVSTHPSAYAQGQWQYRDIDPRILVELQDIRAEVRRLQAALDDLRRTVAAKRR